MAGIKDNNFKDDVVILNADCVYDDSIIQMLDISASSTIFYDPDKWDDESMKISMNPEGKIINISKSIGQSAQSFVSIDLYKIKSNDLKKYLSAIEYYIQNAEFSLWNEVAINRMISEKNVTLFGLSIMSAKWFEIDTVKITKMQKKHLINNLCLDLDGTVYRDGKVFSDIITELFELTNKDIHIMYITNNTSKTIREYSQTLRALGLPYSEGDLITPICVFNDSEFANKRTYVLGSLDVAQEVKNNVSMIQEADQILVTFDKSLTYEKLALVSSAINNGTPYFGSHPDLNCPSDTGPMPDCGAILKLLEATTLKSPVGHFGKPSNSYVNFVKSKLRGGNTLVVGDRYSTDWETGKLLGASAVLVETGDVIPVEAYEQAEVHETLYSVIQKYFG